MRIDEVKNRVDGNRNLEEHIRYIFEHVLTPAPGSVQSVCNAQAKISIIGLEFPGSAALQYLVHNWTGWRQRLSCIAFCNPQHTLKELFSEFPTGSPPHEAIKDEITNFIATRTRAYCVSSKPVEVLLSLRNSLGCNVYSSGEALYDESVFARCWPSVLDWIDLCRFSASYREPVFDAEIESDDERERLRSTKWPTTEEETQAARFHGELDLLNDGKEAPLSSENRS